MGCMDRASLEQLVGEGLSLAEIGRRYGLHESTIGYWLKKHGLQAANREKHAARGGLCSEELEPLVAAGLSSSQIADMVGLRRPRCATGCASTDSRPSGQNGARLRPTVEMTSCFAARATAGPPSSSDPEA